MVSPQRMRAGIVGAGLQGNRRAEAIKRSGIGEVVIVADLNADRARQLGMKAGCPSTTHWEEVTESDDIQVVLVCTPPHLHADIGVPALRSGKYVLCEKPLARTVAEAQLMVEAARAGGARLKCGFNHRHHPGVQQGGKWLEQGLIGRPIFLRSCYGIGGREGYEKEWRANAEIAGGGQLMDQGMHILDLSRWFLGDFQEVCAMLQTAFWDIAPTEDNAFALLRSQSGAVASLHASWTQWKNLFFIEVFGQDGYIRTEGLGGSYGQEKAILGYRDFSKPFTEEIIEFRGEDRSWLDEWQEFASAIREDREPLGNGADGLEALRLAEAIYQSTSIGRTVRL